MQPLSQTHMTYEELTVHADRLRREFYADGLSAVGRKYIPGEPSHQLTLADARVAHDDYFDEEVVVDVSTFHSHRFAGSMAAENKANTLPVLKIRKKCSPPAATSWRRAWLPPLRKARRHCVEHKKTTTDV